MGFNPSPPSREKRHVPPRLSNVVSGLGAAAISLFDSMQNGAMRFANFVEDRYERAKDLGATTGAAAVDGTIRFADRVKGGIRGGAERAEDLAYNLGLARVRMSEKLIEFAGRIEDKIFGKNN